MIAWSAKTPSRLLKTRLPFFIIVLTWFLTNTKKKSLIFKINDNGGRWYILLDEAHKGDKEDSKRQILYSILSRNGFLFNFSATFTDPRDFATCAFNFNLSRFVEEGYGKHIYVSSAEISAFRGRDPLDRKTYLTGRAIFRRLKSKKSFWRPFCF